MKTTLFAILTLISITAFAYPDYVYDDFSALRNTYWEECAGCYVDKTTGFCVAN